MSLGKFRISLSLDQINWILDNCKDTVPELHAQLTLIKFKAETGITAPSYTLAPPKEKAPPKPKPEKNLTLQEKYNIALSLQARGLPMGEYLEGYNEYRYLNDLMTPDEMDTYEKEALGGLE